MFNQKQLFLLTYQATDLFTGGEESSFGDSTGRDETKIERIRRQETETAIFRRNNDPLLHRTRHATRWILLLYQKLDICVLNCLHLKLSIDVCGSSNQ